MELLLIGVAVVSLVLAAVMGLVAWKLLRDGKQRSAARVQLLASLAAADGDGDLLENAPAASASVVADAPIIAAPSRSRIRACAVGPGPG